MIHNLSNLKKVVNQRSFSRAVSSDGLKMALTRKSGNVYIVHLLNQNEKNVCIKRKSSHPWEPELTFSHDAAKILVVTGVSAHVYNSSNGKLLFEYSNLAKVRCSSAQFTADGEKVAFLSFYREIVVFDLHGVECYSIKLCDEVLYFLFLPNGNLLYKCFKRYAEELKVEDVLKTVDLSQDLNDEKVFCTLRQNEASKIIFSPLASKFAVVTWNGAIVFDACSFKQIQRIFVSGAITSIIWDICFYKEDYIVVLTSTLQIWHISKNVRIRNIKLDGHPYLSAICSLGIVLPRVREKTMLYKVVDKRNLTDIALPLLQIHLGPYIILQVFDFILADLHKTSAIIEDNFAHKEKVDEIFELLHKRDKILNKRDVD